MVIDAWELPEDRMDESIARWREHVGLIHAAPGFRDARLHRRLYAESRLDLVNAAHWDSIDARDAALANPDFTASATAAGYEESGPGGRRSHTRCNQGPTSAATPQNPAMDLSSTPPSAP